jgi:hypothetical protein
VDGRFWLKLVARLEYIERSLGKCTQYTPCTEISLRHLQCEFAMQINSSRLDQTESANLKYPPTSKDSKSHLTQRPSTASRVLRNQHINF